ncbi:PREDICTED: uncharacterized protein LOC109244542 [Nicotiana attenuata]|uniref:uncharacterized protein LOC109244542 n=1 Tax=Nicotiana attenuata TaxID=49451 RepID=UPI0009048B7A|nr:PREDICTED: uncharacterized protein LOC109244542 [Nicotiana attenuata]
MVSPIDDEQVIPIFRVAHFLKPTIPSAQKLPFSPSRPNVQELRRSISLKVQFRGGVSVSHLKEWATWVNELKPLYQKIWKKAGIFEAIIASTFKICMHNDLIIALAERWWAETNTFILPWGEASVTLEDMVVLGGYSVLGTLFEKSLCEAHKIIKARKRNVTHHAWMEYFEGRGDHLEHVAFITHWLSKYVLPSKSYRIVEKALFPIAIYLSQGIPMAIAPAVLASIYRDLNLLKQLVLSSSKHREQSSSRCVEDESDLILRAPLHVVQLWAWERFPNLLRKPGVIYSGEPRVVRWHEVKDPRRAIDSTAELFLWRPYAIGTVKNWDLNKFYKEREEYVVVGPKMGREILIFARFIRASELVGVDCVEQYNPHRVSMQFGFDQDVPACVNHASDSPRIAWSNYSRPIKDAKLYIPSRLFESDVTKRYLEWWKNNKFALEDAVKHVTKGQRSRTHQRIPRLSWESYKMRNASSVCCEFAQKSDEVRTDDNIQDCEMRVVESSDDDDNLPIAESLNKRKLMKKEITVPDNQEPLASIQSQSSSASNDGIARERATLMESKPLSKKGGYKLNLSHSLELASEVPNVNRSCGKYAEFSSTGPAKMSLQMSNDSVEAPKVSTNGINRTEGNMQMENIDNHEKRSRRYEMTDLLKLEMRIRNLENIMAGKVPRVGKR